MQWILRILHFGYAYGTLVLVLVIHILADVNISECDCHAMQFIVTCSLVAYFNFKSFTLELLTIAWCVERYDSHVARAVLAKAFHHRALRDCLRDRRSRLVVRLEAVRVFVIT